MNRNSGPLPKGQRGGGNKVYRHSVPLSKSERGGGNIVYTHSGTLSKGQREVGDSVQTVRTSNKRSGGRWETVNRHSGPLCKGQMGGGIQCRDTQDLYLNVRGEVGDSLQTLRTSIYTSEGSWEHLGTY